MVLLPSQGGPCRRRKSEADEGSGEADAKAPHLASQEQEAGEGEERRCLGPGEAGEEPAAVARNEARWVACVQSRHTDSPPDEGHESDESYGGGDSPAGTSVRLRPPLVSKTSTTLPMRRTATQILANTRCIVPKAPDAHSRLCSRPPYPTKDLLLRDHRTAEVIDDEPLYPVVLAIIVAMSVLAVVFGYALALRRFRSGSSFLSPFRCGDGRARAASYASAYPGDAQPMPELALRASPADGYRTFSSSIHRLHPVRQLCARRGYNGSSRTADGSGGWNQLGCPPGPKANLGA